MRRIATRLTLAMVAVAVLTAIVSLPTSMLYFERRLEGLPPEIAAAADRQIRANVPADFDGLGELLISAGAAAALGSALGLVIARRLARPLRALSVAAQQLSGGDLAARVPQARAARGGDEVAGLVADFNAMAGTLQRLEGERRATAAGVAHELRTPLTVLQGRLEAARDGVLVLDADELAVLIGQTRLLGRLIEDLRTLSLADAGRLSLHRRPTDLADLATAVLTGHRERAGRAGTTLTGDLATGPPIAVDPERIAQVLGNLLDNALQHTPAGGTVHLTLAHTPDGADLAVTDTGPGLPPEDLQRVFDRFYRTDAARSRATGGTGQGLAIVRALIEAHGGTVVAAHRGGGGAAFRVHLPADHRGDPGPVGSGPARGGSPGR